MHEREGRRRPGRWYSRAAWAEEQGALGIGSHVVMRLADESGIARTPETLRHASSILLRHGEDRGLVSHCVADTHAHALLLCTREEAGTFACVAEGALRKQLRLPVPFQQCRIRPIVDERHLGHAAPYVHRQESRHGTAFDLLHDGSSLPDLLGMRMGSPWLRDRFRQALPRVTRDTILSWADAEAIDDAVLDVQYLADAAAAAWCTADLEGTSVAHARARRCAVHWLDRLAPRAGVNAVLGIPSRSGVRYRTQPVSDAEMRAVALQMKLRKLRELQAASSGGEGARVVVAR